VINSQNSRSLGILKSEAEWGHQGAGRKAWGQLGVFRLLQLVAITITHRERWKTRAASIQQIQGVNLLKFPDF
jgi:hypothetical protein